MLEAENTRAFLVGSVGLLAVYPDERSVDPILGRASELMRGYLSDLAFSIRCG